MKSRSALPLVTLVAISLVGCSPNKPAAPTTPTPDDKKTTPAVSQAVAPPIDASLKTDAYNYYGLGNTKELTFNVLSDDKPTEGTQTVSFKEMKDGYPVITLKRAGGLTNLGDEDVQVRPDGVYMVSASFGTVDPPMLLLPAKLEVGKSWKANTKITSSDGQVLEVDATYTLAAKEKVKVPAGEFDAIKVVAKGTITNTISKGAGKTAKTTSPMDAEEWDVDGIGSTRLKATTRDDKGQTKVSIVELKKQG